MSDLRSSHVMKAASEAPGIGVRPAARKYGVPRSTVRECMKREGIEFDPMADSAVGEHDMALSVMAAVMVPGVAWSQQDIADVCGVSRQCVQNIERRALRKVRNETGKDLLRELKSHLNYEA